VRELGGGKVKGLRGAQEWILEKNKSRVSWDLKEGSGHNRLIKGSLSPANAVVTKQLFGHKKSAARPRGEKKKRGDWENVQINRK